MRCSIGLRCADGSLLLLRRSRLLLLLLLCLPPLSLLLLLLLLSYTWRPLGVGLGREREGAIRQSVFAWGYLTKCVCWGLFAKVYLLGAI